MRLTLLILLGLLINVGASAYEFEPKVPADLQKQFNADVDLIKSVTLSSATGLHSQIYGNQGGQQYFDFFNSRVKKVGLNSCGDAKAVACVIPWYGSTSIWLTPNYTKFSHPAIARLMIIFHETRHTEVRNNNWPHATCPDPFVDANGNEIKSIWTGATLAGESACDGTHLGAYASTVIMLKNIEKKCSSCNEKLMMDAGIYSNDQFKRVTNSSSVDTIKKDFSSL